MDEVIKIPIYEPYFSGLEKINVNKCLDSTWISSKGEFLHQFEAKFSNYIGINYATAVCNGTVALHLALVALGIGPGDEVIVPTLTYIASVNAIKYTGATPVFVDSLENTWQIDPSDILKKITKNTKAIMCVHLYGHPCEMNEILSIKNKFNLYLIEDCAEAIGSKYNNQFVGTFGDIATFSFYGNKTITTGEGGMVTTNNYSLYNNLVHYKGQGLAKHRQYWHDVIGFNYRMTNLAAAIGVAQMEVIDEIIIKKRKIAEKYKNGLDKNYLKFHDEQNNVYHSYWMFSIVLKNPALRDPLMGYLTIKGIETRPLFYPVHTMPMYSNVSETFPIAEDLGWKGINLPSYPALEDELVEYIIRNINNFLKENQ